MIFSKHLWRCEVPPKNFYFSSENISVSQMFQELLKYLQIPLNFFGFGVYSDDYVFFSRKFVAWTIVAIAVTGIVVYDIYAVREDATKLISCLVSLTLVPQVAARFYTFIFLRNEHVSLKHQSVKFIESCKHEIHQKIYENLMMKTTHFYFCYVIANYLALIAMLAFQLFYLVAYNERVLMVPFEIPFSDYQHSLAGYVANLIFHVTVAFLYMYSTVATIGSVIIFVTVIFAQFNILEVLLDDLNEMARTGSHEEAYEILRTIVEVHTKLKE